MNIEVIPVTITEINWPMYIDACIKAGIEPPTKKLDAGFFNQRDLAAFLASLSTGDLRNALRNINHILRHASVGFLIKASLKELSTLQSQTRLTTSTLDEELYLVSGTLEEWKQAIVDLSNRTTATSVRYIMNCCLLFMERGNLYEVFGNYRKESLPDQTFILQRKE